MDTGLLSCSDSDRLSAFGVAYGIGLGIFQRDQGNDQVNLCFLRDFFVLCHHISKKILVDL